MVATAAAATPAMAAPLLRVAAPNWSASASPSASPLVVGDAAKVDGEGGLDASPVEEDGVEVVASATAGPNFLDTGAVVVVASGVLAGANFLAATSGALAGVDAFDAFGDSAEATTALRAATTRM